jgi:hypothetical protein
MKKYLAIAISSIFMALAAGFGQTPVGVSLSSIIGVAHPPPLNNATSGQDRKQNASGISFTSLGRFSLALAGAHLPGGYVWLRKCGTEEEPMFPLDSRALPLKDVLDSIVRMDPRYKWQNEKGIINLLPAEGEPVLLNVRIRHYKVDADLNQALRELLRLPEVTSGASSLGLKLNTARLLVGPSPIYPFSLRIKVDVSDITLRDALNALVRAHGRAIWEYREFRCNGTNEFSVNFVAR